MSESGQEQSPIYSRNAEFYSSIFGFTPESLKGASVLNLCAGASDIEPLLKQYGADYVTSVDQAYSEKEYRARMDVSGDKVAVNMKDLPFVENSFDVSLSLWGLLHPIEDLNESALGEMIRVTKKTVHVYPLLCDFKVLEKMLEENKLSEYVTVDKVKFDPKLFFSGLGKEGLMSTLFANAYWNLLEAETIVKGNNNKMVIDVEKIKELPEHEQQRIVRVLSEKFAKEMLVNNE